VQPQNLFRLLRAASKREAQGKGALINNMTENSSAVLPAVVEKIIKLPHEPEKAQVAIEGGDDLYREIRIENTLIDENAREVSLKPGAEVEVTVEANTRDTVPKA
jgi:hypothetical protein